LLRTATVVMTSQMSLDNTGRGDFVADVILYVTGRRGSDLVVY